MLAKSITLVPYKYRNFLLYKKDENLRFSFFRPSRVFDRKEENLSHKLMFFLCNKKENQYIKGCKSVTFLLHKKGCSKIERPKINSLILLKNHFNLAQELLFFYIYINNIFIPFRKFTH